MKRALLCLAAAAVTSFGGIASARPYRDRDHDGIPNRYDRHDNRGHRWRRGEHLDSRFHSRNYMVSDWRRHGWRAPPRGYAYYRTDNGDVVMAAVASGIVASVIANAMAH
jgi:Ni/Co efflux regulator RcnB